jgi:predicted metal-dependent phosphoesterase TrpH
MTDPAFCDLHSHTLHSDGVLSPAALVELAQSQGVRVLGLTDHDTLAGLPAAVARGRELGVEVVPGIELSVEEDGRDIHLLGYFVSRPGFLEAALAEIQRSRRQRAREIVERLGRLGVHVRYADVEQRARGGVVGRPHVAEEIVACGHAATLNEAFDRWIGTGGPAYVPKRTVSLVEGVEMLRRAGAVPVVAHPGVSDCDDLLPRFHDQGVQGLEVWHPQHGERLVRFYLQKARQYGLVPTGGSDFHREAPGCTLPGGLRLPLAVVDVLRPLAG